MTIPAFLYFAPVPLKTRHDGWSPDLQLRFVAALARGATPGEAARRLGMSRQGAYALRTREGAEEFASSWDAALRFAREARIAAASAARAPAAPPPEPEAQGDVAALAAFTARLRAQGAAGDPDLDRRTFNALLDRVYRHRADNRDKADKADRP